MNKIFFYLIYHEFLLQNDVSNVYMSNYNAKLTFFVYFRNLLFWGFFFNRDNIISFVVLL